MRSNRREKALLANQRAGWKGRAGLGQGERQEQVALGPAGERLARRRFQVERGAAGGVEPQARAAVDQPLEEQTRLGQPLYLLEEQGPGRDGQLGEIGEEGGR